MSENITSTDSAESRDDKPIKKNKKQNGRSGGSEKKSKPARNLANLKTKEERNTKIFLVLSFFVPFLIMAVVFAKKGVYPFGDRQIMFSDCKQQYLPFLKEYQRKLQSGDSLFYSWHNGFGTNFMAMIGYYIASPLNLLTIFIPIKFVREAMTVFTLIKIGCSSLFTAVYLKHVYKRNDLSLVAFGCSYAFCDYIMGYYWNVIWLDSIALLPLAALGVYCVVYEKKYKLFVISLAAAFLSSYYIGFMICVFVALWFLVVSIIKKSTIPQLCEDLLKMAGYSVLALSMTLFVTLTAYAQLKYTVGADDDFPTKIQLYNNFMEVLANILSFNQPTTMEGLPNIATGMFCILMLVIFVRSKSIPMREKAAYLSLLGFLFVSLNINVLDYIWHGFHYPNLIPYRFAFLFSFVFIVIAYRAYTSFVELDKKDIIGMCILMMALVCAAVFYLERRAILGSLIVAALYIVFMTLYELDLLNRQMLNIFASLVIIAEMCVRCSVGVDTVGTTNHNDYPASEDEITQMTDKVISFEPNEFFRIEQTEYSTKNDGMMYGYNGISQFSSTTYKSLLNFTSDFGISSKRSSYMYMITSPIVPMLTNLKYIIVRDGFTANDPFMEKYLESDSEDVVMYRNKYYLPIGYMTDNKVNSVKMDNSSVFVTQNKVMKALSGIDEDVYTLLSPYYYACDNMSHSEEEGGLYSYHLDSGARTGRISVTYRAPKDGMLYAWANVRSSDELSVLSESIDHTYDVDGCRFIFPLGYYKKGETVELTADVEEDDTNEIAAAYLNEDVLNKCYESLNDEGFQVTNYTSTKMEGTIKVSADGTFMTSIPYEKGWKLYVDGKPAQTKELLGAFLGTDLEKGEHEIRLSYFPEGLAAGISVSVIAVLIFAAMCVRDRISASKKKKPAK